MNTNHLAHSPIYVIRAKEYERGERNNQNPVIIAYNSSHYESLETIDDNDNNRAIELVES